MMRKELIAETCRRQRPYVTHVKWYFQMLVPVLPIPVLVGYLLIAGARFFVQREPASLRGALDLSGVIYAA